MSEAARALDPESPEHIREAAERIRAAQTEPMAEEPEPDTDPVADRIYGMLAEHGLTVDRSKVDLTEAKRLLASFGTVVSLPYGHTPKATYRGRLYTGAEIVWPIFESICRFVEEGGSLRRALARPGMPDWQVWIAWKETSETTRNRYERARQENAHAHVDWITDISCDLVADPDPTPGKVAAARLATDNAKWVASKLHRVAYGEPKEASPGGYGEGGFIAALERIEQVARKIEGRRALPIIDLSAEQPTAAD